MTTLTSAPAVPAALVAHFGDRLVRPDDARYHSARSVWNGMVDKHPRAVARCTDDQDVRIALLEAAAAGLPISVRGGGHQIAGGAVADDGIVLDLSPLRFADVDPAGSTVTVGGGALLGDLDRALARYRVAVPAGVVSHTGVGGLTLGGGIGWLSRSRGLTSDSLIGATVVDGRGRRLEVDRDRHAELFWALRGGGGSFATVLSFRYRTEPIGRITFGMRVLEIDQARDALLEFGRLAPDLPRDLQVMVKLQRTGHPGGVPVDHLVTAPGAAADRPVVSVEWLWSGDPAGLGEATDLLRLGGRGVARISRKTFAAVQSQQDHRYPHGWRYYLKPGHLQVLGPAQVDAVLTAADTMPAGDVQIEMLTLGGAITDVAEDATAYPRRSAGVAFNVTGGWPDAHADAEYIGWARQTHQALSGVGTAGAYLNFLGAETPDLTAVFGAEKLDRLRAVKREYDPDDLYRPAVHIAP